MIIYATNNSSLEKALETKYATRFNSEVELFGPAPYLSDDIINKYLDTKYFFKGQFNRFVLEKYSMNTFHIHTLNYNSKNYRLYGLDSLETDLILFLTDREIGRNDNQVKIFTQEEAMELFPNLGIKWNTNLRVKYQLGTMIDELKKNGDHIILSVEGGIYNKGSAPGDLGFTVGKRKLSQILEFIKNNLKH